MGAEATLTPGQLQVAPGGETQAAISVKNSGPVVDSFALTVLGDAAGWAVCEPEDVSLFPGQDETVRILFRPPMSPDLPHGPVPFAVRVASSEDPPGSVVEEGILDIGGVSLVSVDMSPRTGRARGMRASRHRVALDNRGNARAIVDLVGSDDADTVDVKVTPPELEVAPGSAVFAQVRVRARRRFWRGPGVTHRFQVTAHPPGEPPVRSEGTLLQEAVLPDWLPKAIAIAAAAAVAAVALWFAVLRPVVRDAATNAGTAAAQQVLNNALQPSGGASNGTGGATGSNTSSAPAPTPSGTTKGGGSGASPSPSPSPGSGLKISLPAPVPFAQTLDSGSPTITAPAKHAFAVTDLVMQNPAGDQGTLTVSRAGQVLFSEELANFRDYDLHFITAIVVPSGQSLSFSVGCKNPGGKACTPVVLISGENDTTSF
jgi:hypothetical protein